MILILLYAQIVLQRILMMNIQINKIQCNDCKEVIESTHRHHFVGCRCYNESAGLDGVYIDGGRDYLRRGGMNYTDLSEYEDDFLGS
jgi:hypothetical protein